ncbi:tryptophan synthase beta subunit-like PLP-dependent enzyme [Umbelopsis sp. AD052]|nr:tryptophan synthase beta subunit-like PLP-dependent enzyme [Umbelopsis sp. AD052]
MVSSQSSKLRHNSFFNPAARSVFENAHFDPRPLSFHKQLPGYCPTPLVELASVAEKLGVRKVLLKNESSRFGLPAFKFLGASWGAYRAIAQLVDYTDDNSDTSYNSLKRAISSFGSPITLFAATEGNHGRAIAHVASLLGVKSHIFVPQDMYESTKNLIMAEGATLTNVAGDYDLAVQMAYDQTRATPGGLYIQDTAFNGYEEIPQWIVDGYDTMLQEIDDQTAPLINNRCPDVVITPVGVGSLAQAVVSHYKRSRNHNSTTIITVEPDTAACLKGSLEKKAFTTISTSHTIMSGLHCATLSTIAWPLLSRGVDIATSVSDIECHQAVQELDNLGVSAGPCGAATLATLLSIHAHHPEIFRPDSVIVLLCTEGSRAYTPPLDISIDDPVALTQALVRIDSPNPDLSSGGGGGETKIADYISAWLAHRQFEISVLEKHPRRPSVIGVARGSGKGGKSLMFNGHIDTVTLAGYHGDPLSGEIRNECVYGRGAFDMKAGVAASMIAAVSAKDHGVGGDIIIAAVADEENASIGTQEVLEAGWRADAAIVSEPSYLQVTMAHKGFVWFYIDVIGKAAHGSRPELGIDAIAKAGHFLVALEKYGQDLMQSKEPYIRHPVLGTGTVHASLIQGGEEPSSYPAKCTITIERRTVPGENAYIVEAQMRSILDDLVNTVDDFQYTLRQGLSRAPLEVEPTDPIATCLLKHTQDVLGHSPVIRAEPFWTDAALLADHGIPAILFGVDGDGAHAAVEWATISSIYQVTDVLTRVALEFCAEHPV